MSVKPIEYKFSKSTQEKKVEKPKIIEGKLEIKIYNPQDELVEYIKDKNTDVFYSIFSINRLTHENLKPVIFLITKPLEQLSFDDKNQEEFINNLKGLYCEYLENPDISKNSSIYYGSFQNSFDVDGNNKVLTKLYQYLNTSSKTVYIYGLSAFNPYNEPLTIYKFEKPIILPPNYKLVLKYVIKYEDIVRNYHSTQDYNPSIQEIVGNTVIQVNQELLRKLRQTEYKRTFLQGVTNPENKLLILDDTYIPSSSVKIKNIYSKDTETGKAFGKDSQFFGELIIRITQDGNLGQAKAKIFLGNYVDYQLFKYDNPTFKLYPWKEYPPFVKQKQNLIDNGSSLITDRVYPFYSVEKLPFYLVKTKSFYLYIDNNDISSLTQIIDIDDTTKTYDFTTEKIVDNIYKITLNLDTIPDKLGIILNFNSSRTVYPFLIEDDKDDQESNIYWVVQRLILYGYSGYNNNDDKYIKHISLNELNEPYIYATEDKNSQIIFHKDTPTFYNYYINLDINNFKVYGYEDKNFWYNICLISLDKVQTLNLKNDDLYHNHCYSCCWNWCSTKINSIYIYLDGDLYELLKNREYINYYFENIPPNNGNLYKYYNPTSKQFDYTFDFNSIPEITLTETLDILNLHIEFDENSSFKVGDTIRIRINDNDKLLILDKLEKFEWLKYGTYIQEPIYLNENIEKIETHSILRTDSRRRDDSYWNFGKTPKYIVSNVENNLKDEFKNIEEQKEFKDSNSNNSIFPEYDKIHYKLSYHNQEYYDKYSEVKYGDILFANSIEQEEQQKFDIFKNNSKLLKLTYQIDLIRDGGVNGKITSDFSYYEPYNFGRISDWNNTVYASGVQNCENFILAVPKYYDIQTKDENGNTTIERYYTDLRTLKLFLRGGHNKPLAFTFDLTGYWNMSSFDIELTKGYYLVGINKEQIKQVLNSNNLDFENDIYIEGYIRAFKLEDLLPIKIPVDFQYQSGYWKDYLNSKNIKKKYINNKNNPLNDNSELIYIGFDNEYRDLSNNNITVNLYGSESYIENGLDNGASWFNDGSSRCVWFDLGDKFKLPLTFTGWFIVRDINRRLITGVDYSGTPTDGKFDLQIYTKNNLFCINIGSNGHELIWNNENSDNSIPIEQNQWYFYVVKLSQQQLEYRIYDINFNLIGIRTFDLSDKNVIEPVDTKLAVGAWINVVNKSGFENYFNGSIDNYRIFNKLLTDDEIEQVFQKDLEKIQVDYTQIQDWFENEGKFLIKIILPFEIDGKVKVKNIYTGKEYKFCIISNDYPQFNLNDNNLTKQQIKSGNILLVEIDDYIDLLYEYVSNNYWIYHNWYQLFNYTTDKNDLYTASYPICSYSLNQRTKYLRPDQNFIIDVESDSTYINNLTLGKFNAVITKFDNINTWVYTWWSRETWSYTIEPINLLLTIERDENGNDNRDYSIIFGKLSNIKELQTEIFDQDTISLPNYTNTLPYLYTTNGELNVEDWDKYKNKHGNNLLVWTPLYRGVIYSGIHDRQRWNFYFPRFLENNIFVLRLLQSFDFINTFTHANYIFNGFDYSFKTGYPFYTIYPIEIKEIENSSQILDDTNDNYIEQIIKPVSSIRFQTQPVEYFKPTNPEHLKDISKIGLYYLGFDINNSEDVEFLYPEKNDYRVPYNPLSNWNTCNYFTIYYNNLIPNSYIYTENNNIKKVCEILKNKNQDLKTWDNNHHIGILDNDTNLQNDNEFQTFGYTTNTNITIEFKELSKFEDTNTIPNKFILNYTSSLRKFSVQNNEWVVGNYNFGSYIIYFNGYIGNYNILNKYYSRYYNSQLLYSYGYWIVDGHHERNNNYIVIREDNNNGTTNGVFISEKTLDNYINISKSTIAGETNRDIALFLTKKEFELQDIADFGNLNIWSIYTKNFDLGYYYKEIPVIYIENKNDNTEYYLFALTQDFKLVDITSILDRIKNYEHNKLSFKTVRHLYSGKTYSYFNGKIQKFLETDNIQNYKFKYGLLISIDKIEEFNTNIDDSYYKFYVNEKDFSQSVYVILGFDIQPRFKDKQTFIQNYKKIDKIAYVNSKTSLFANNFNNLVSDINDTIKIYNPNDKDIETIVYIDLKKVLNYNPDLFQDGILAYVIDETNNTQTAIPVVYERKEYGEKQFFVQGRPTTNFEKWNKKGIYVRVNLKANSITKIKLQNGTNNYKLEDVFPWIYTFENEKQFYKDWTITPFIKYNSQFECLEIVKIPEQVIKYKGTIDFLKDGKNFVNNRIVVSMYSKFRNYRFSIRYYDDDYKYGFEILRNQTHFDTYGINRNLRSGSTNLFGVGGVIFKQQYFNDKKYLLFKFKTNLLLDQKREDFDLIKVNDSSVQKELNNYENSTFNNPTIGLWLRDENNKGKLLINFIYIDWSNYYYEPVVLYYEDLYIAFDGMEHKSSTYFYTYDNNSTSSITEIDKGYFNDLVWNTEDNFNKGLMRWNISNYCPNEIENALTIRVRPIYSFNDVFNNYMLNLFLSYSPFRWIV